MQKVGHQPAEKQPTTRRGSAVAPSSRNEQTAQLEAKINASPDMAAQRMLNNTITRSPRQLAQRQLADGINNSPRQAAQLEQRPAPKPNRTGLPDNLKSGIEHLSGMAMDHVKVHYNSSRPAQLNALAYAQGSDIHVAPGQEKHLPHEAWHVVQQAQGRVKPTMQMKAGVPINDDKSLAREADLMGSRALEKEVTQRAGEYEIGQESSLNFMNIESMANLPGRPVQSVPTQMSCKNSFSSSPNKGAVLQRYLTIGSKKTGFKQYKSFQSLPKEAQETIDKVKLSDKKYNDLADWIGEWHIFLRMNDESDIDGLTESLKKVFMSKGGDLDKVKKSGKVYGLGSVPLLPGGAKGGRPLGSSIQDDLNNSVVGGKNKDLKGSEANEFAEFLDGSKYAPEKGRQKGKQFDTKINTDFKKLCKAGIVFHTKGRKTKKTIHFELSGLDMYEVVSKIGGGGSITKAELRSIYRQYLVHLSGKEPTIDLTQLKFYFLGHEVPPPWKEDPALWKLYKPKFHDRLEMQPSSSGSWMTWKTAALGLLVILASYGIYKKIKK